MNNIGKKIKELRLENKLSQTKLAERLNVSQDTISLWERDISLPSADYIIKLCKIFEISADCLLGIDD